MSWHSVPCSNLLSGASLSPFGKFVLQIGGNVPIQKSNISKKNQQSSRGLTASSIPPMLQLSSLQIPSMVWKPQLINTKGHRNRQYHASITLRDNTVLVFGGLVTATGNGQVADEILEIKNTIFGLTVNSTNRAHCSLQGLTAVAANDVAFLYGGCSQDKVYSPEISIYMHADLALDGITSPMAELPVDGEKPPARAFHSCVLTGPSNNLMIVFGGQSSSGELLSDVWMCDLRDVIAAIVTASSPALVEEGETAPPKPSLPPIKWTCLLESSKLVSPRYLHSSVAYLSSKEMRDQPVACVQLAVFGGSTIGNKSAGAGYYEASLVLEGEEYVLEDFLLKENLPLPQGSQLNGAAVAALGSNDIAAGVVVFFCGPAGLLKVLDDKSELAVAMRRAVVKNVSMETDSSKPKVTGGVGLPKKVRYDNGDIYEGQLIRPSGESDADPIVPENLVRHGSGQMRYGSGPVERYDGCWISGQREGSGVSIGSGQVYEGSFLANRWHGRGSLKDSATDQVIYEGEFANGFYHGSGKLFRPDGLYEGSFVDGKRDGRGVLTNLDSGYFYAGDWANDQIAGVGEVRELSLMEDGGIPGTYSGPTFRGTPSGANGLCAYPDGSEYRGEWKSGRKNGMGRFVAANNDVLEGKFVGGLLWSGRWLSHNGNESYEGYWENNRPHGFGIRQYANGEVYEGEWSVGKRLDTGVQRTADVKEWGGGKK